MTQKGTKIRMTALHCMLTMNLNKAINAKQIKNTIPYKTGSLACRLIVKAKETLQKYFEP